MEESSFTGKYGFHALLLILLITKAIYVLCYFDNSLLL